MSPIPVHLAVEDPLSEAVMRTLLRALDRDYHVGVCYGRTGFGYLRKMARGFNQAAKGVPFILSTDLDSMPCPPALIEEWVGVPLHPNFIFRVAVREVEAWLLADAAHLAEFLRVRQNLVPTDCENLIDPKRELIDLARRARSAEIRGRLVPKKESTAQQGPDYNACLTQFVTNGWNIHAACEASASLKRTVERLRIFEPCWD